MKLIKHLLIASGAALFLLCESDRSSTSPETDDSTSDTLSTDTAGCENTGRPISSVDSILGKWRVVRKDKRDMSGTITRVRFIEDYHVHVITRDSLISWVPDSTSYQVRKHRFIFTDSRMVTEDFYADVRFREDTLQLRFSTDSLMNVHHCLPFNGVLPLETDDLPEHEKPH